MSKIGQTPVQVPTSVQVQLDPHKITVRGGSTSLEYAVPDVLDVGFENNILVIGRKKEDKRTRSMHGFFRKQLSNAVVGLEKPWQKKLEIVGTGYNAKMQGEDILIKVGYSHPVVFKKVAGITLAVEGTSIIVVSGIDRQLVGQIAYQIKTIRKPDPYKGKGIRYQGEKLRIKPGKKAKAAGA